MKSSNPKNFSSRSLTAQSQPLALGLADHLLRYHGLRMSAVGGSEEGKSADATMKFSGVTHDDQPVFAVVSSPLNPDHIQRAVENIALAHTTLPAKTAAPILRPLIHGQTDGLSYAVWPRQLPLIDGGAVVRRVRKAIMHFPLHDWALDLCRDSQRSLKTAGCQAYQGNAFGTALRFVSTSELFPDHMRQSAKLALGRRERGLWTPKHCYEHGDLWTGNILRDCASPAPNRFHVIDWIGMKAQGFPIYDFARLVASLNTPKVLAKAYAQKYAKALRCKPCDLHGYALAALGAIGQDLDHFNPEQFQRMALRVDKTIVDLTNGGLRPDAGVGSLIPLATPRVLPSRLPPPRITEATAAQHSTLARGNRG